MWETEEKRDDDDGGDYIRLFRDIVKRNYYVFK
jgi:hypothetical protein